MERIKRNIVEDVPHELTTEEKAERGNQLAQCMEDVKDADAEHKEAVRAHKLRRAELMARVNALQKAFPVADDPPGVTVQSNGG